MGKKPNLQLDISQVTLNAPVKSIAREKSHDKEHTHYIDLVRNLRRPETAGPIIRWMETGRVGDQPYSSLSLEQKSVRPRRESRILKTQEHERVVEADGSGSQTKSMSEDVYSGEDSYSDEEMEKKVKENREFFQALQAGVLKPVPDCKGSH